MSHLAAEQASVAVGDEDLPRPVMQRGIGKPHYRHSTSLLPWSLIRVDSDFRRFSLRKASNAVGVLISKWYSNHVLYISWRTLTLQRS